MPRRPTDSPARDRLLTPLGGLVLAFAVSVAAFWVPAINLLS